MSKRKRLDEAQEVGTAVLEPIGGESPTDGADRLIAMSEPYIATVTITGVCPLVFHAWNNESVAEKAGAAKGSKAKKTDDVESYIYRDKGGFICIPGSYLRGSIVNAAKFKQDPRSPRKSMMDLAKAAVLPLTEFAPVARGVDGQKTKEWDYIDMRRVVVQRNAITRSRPAFREGWRATFDLMVSLPEYVSPALLHDLISSAGKLVGVAEMRPTYGRFRIDCFDIRSEK